MAPFARIVHRLSQELDRVAGWALVAMMALIVINIVMRRLLHPILGTYEFVGFLAVLVISLAIAYCAVQKGHIAVGFFADRLPQRTQAIINVILGIISIVFFGLVIWQVSLYAAYVSASGQVSDTTRTPYYPFIYLAGFGFTVLCLVLIVDLFKAVARLVRQ